MKKTNFERRFGLKSSLAALVVLSLSACGGGDGGVAAPLAASTPGVPAGGGGFSKGVVAVSHPLAAKVGADVLAAGGNAVDAAAAIQMALSVVEPQSSGLGGGGFMMIHLAKEGKTFYIDSREKAPAAATPNMFGDLSFEDASTTGISVGVPGTVRGVSHALSNWGTISLSKAIEPAIALAEGGFAINAPLAEDIVNTSDRGFQMTNLYPETAALFRPSGVPLKAGAVLKQPDLAKTLKLIAANGPDAFYRGDIAAAIVAAQTRSATSGAAGAALTRGRPGAMSLADLSNYTVAVRQPVMATYRGFGVATMPPPSGGGIAVAQQLRMLEQFPLGDSSRGFGFGDKNTLHVMIEAMRLSFADRNFWVGDADFVNVPVTGLLSSSYVQARAALIKVATALGSSAIVAGNPLPQNTATASVASSGLAAAGNPREGAHTTHFVVADKDNNVVSYTTTIESLFGSGITVPGYGFLLNNQLSDFNWPPTAGTSSSDIGANDAAPFKRPRSSMSPTMLFKDGKAFAAMGSAGGSKIINAVVQMTVNMVDHGMSVEQAVDAPRIHAGKSGSVFCETGPFTPTGFTPTPALSASVVASVSAMREPGLNMPPCNGNESNGANLSAQALVIDLNTGLKYGAADKRREGAVRGVQ